MKKPSISIHILNYNGKRFLKECIDSLLKQKYPNYEIVIVDNASKDDSILFINNRYKKEIKNKKVRILGFKKNYGVAGAYNRSYKETDADYILLLNNDIIIPKTSFLDQLVKTSIKEKAPMVSGWTYPFKMSNSEKEEIENMKTPTVTILGFATEDTIRENVSVIAGVCCLLIEKSKVKSPIFPEIYFCYGEDIFLGWNAFLQGTKNIFDKKIPYLHYGSGTAQKKSYFVRYHAERNRLANLLTFYEKKTLLKVLPLLILETLVKSVFYVRRPEKIKAIVNANIWVVKNLKEILKQRKKVQKERKISDKELLLLMSSKIFPGHITPKISKVLNSISKNYCRLVNIKTYS
jgi:GT2 family glycosyltransferase